MKLLERILVAVDGRQSADNVLAEATAIAKKFGSEIILMQALPTERSEDEEMKQYWEMAREGASSRLEKYKKELEENEVRVGELVIVEGTPFYQIIHQAEEFDVNVVLLGASKREEENETSRLGFTAERVCRKSSKPVWLVHPKKRADKEHILCPVDLSSPSRRALRNAIHLARQFKAKLTVLHVVRPMSTIIGIELPTDTKGKERYFEGEKKRFHEFLEDFDFHEVETERMILFGDPGEKITQIARELNTQLIVMGSVGRTGLARILLGSVAGTVLYDLPCSIIMVKAEEAIRLKMEEHLTDIREHHAQGLELLENGFPEESIRKFKHCISVNEMFLPAWEALAQAYERLGDQERAKKTRKTVEELEEILSWRRIEAEIRGKHSFWKS